MLREKIGEGTGAFVVGCWSCWSAGVGLGIVERER